MRLKPSAPPSGPCPVCDQRKTDAASIAEHNRRASICGESQYRGPNRC